MNNHIKVIDLFAGPGGLGEGFSSYMSGGKQAFKIALSIEKEASAHRTLLLRAFFRQFEQGNAPEAYYEFLKGRLGEKPEDQLYRLPEYAGEYEAAIQEAQQLTLGETGKHRQIYGKIRAALGGADCVLIGGPPCQAYSLVGRSKNYGDKDINYIPEEDHKNFLYEEYLRIIAKFQPLVFAMENVKGMLSAKVNGKPIFGKIRKDLQNPCGIGTKPDDGREKHKYRIVSFIPKTGTLELLGSDDDRHENDFLDPHDFIIRSENYGVPQARHRVILLGIREDIFGKLANIPLLENEYREKISVSDAICDLPKLRSRLSKDDTAENWINAVRSIKNTTLREKQFPGPVRDKILATLEQLDVPADDFGANTGLIKTSGSGKKLPPGLREWYRDPGLGNHIANHQARGHIVEDLHRYLYCSCFAAIEGRSPTSPDFPEALYPNHDNFHTGKFADRFRVQLRDKPATTVTSHISKDGHYYIHYDASQCRSLTVREAARLQTFPDNYFFAGNRTQQYVQVGNAVPPFLARQLAAVVYGIVS